MNNLLIKTVIVVALAFGFGAVSPTYAGILDITDPDNPVERFFDIHLHSTSNDHFTSQTHLSNLIIEIDASQPGVLVASARGNKMSRNTAPDVVVGREFSLHDALSATLTTRTFPGSTVSQIIVVFAGGRGITIGERGPARKVDLIGGFAAFSFDEATGAVVGTFFIQGQESSGIGHQIIGVASKLTPNSTVREL